MHAMQAIYALAMRFVNDKNGNINKLLGALLLTVIGVAFIPVVVSQVATANTDGMSAGTKALFDLIPFFYVILVVVAVVSFIKFGGES